jgi:hypothetical protein
MTRITITSLSVPYELIRVFPLPPVQLMKSQTVFVILAAIIAIFGVTFASQYLVRTKKNNASDGPITKGLYFPIDSSRQWLHPQSSIANTEEKSILGTEMEVGMPGAYDFWFQNSQDVALEVALKSKTCKCTEVNICLAGNEIQDWNEKATKGVLASCFPATGIVNSGTAILSSMDFDQALKSAPTLDWKRLGDEVFVVPPQAFGIVRLNWNAKQPAVQNLKAEITTKPKEGPASSSSLFLSVPIVFVDPFHVEAGEVAIGTINVGGDPVERKVVCWSSTRSHFSLRIGLANDPFIVCGEPTPLSDGERWKMEVAEKTRVASAYWVPLMVREQAEIEENKNGKKQKKIVQMDLGPFTRQVPLIANESPTPIHIRLQGDIKDPDISVSLDGHDTVHDRVSFGTFPANDGASLSATIGAPARFTLSLDMVPSFLKAKLDLNEAESSPVRNSWKLKLQMLPGSISGVFPDPANPELSDTAITLKMQGASSSRGIRIPVHGNATFR